MLAPNQPSSNYSNIVYMHLLSNIILDLALRKTDTVHAFMQFIF